MKMIVKGIKNEGGVISKSIREIEILCSAGNIPESIDVDVIDLPLGGSIRLTELNLPDGSEIPGLDETTDQMIVSINAPKAVVEEEPVVVDDEAEDEAVEAASEGGEDSSNEDTDEGSEQA
jgi:large subunit ribosomal protein L25